MSGHPIGYFAEVLFAFMWLLASVTGAFFGGAWVARHFTDRSRKHWVPYGQFTTAGKVAGWIVGIALLFGLYAVGHAIPGVGSELDRITESSD